MGEVGSSEEWDDQFQTDLRSRIEKCSTDDERTEIITLGNTWISKEPIVRYLCERFMRCIVRRDLEEEAALRRNQGGKHAQSQRTSQRCVNQEGKQQDECRGSTSKKGKEKQDDDEYEEDDDSEYVEQDTLQVILNDQCNWKERDLGSTRRVMVKMLSKSPPINPPYITLPFGSWKVAKEFVDFILDMFEVGERGCARYFCLAREYETEAMERFLALGVMIVSPHRVLFFTSIYELTLAQLAAGRMHKYMAEIDAEGYDYEDEEEQVVILPDGPWACPFCTYINCEAKDDQCEVCDNSRSGK